TPCTLAALPVQPSPAAPSTHSSAVLHRAALLPLRSRSIHPPPLPMRRPLLCLAAGLGSSSATETSRIGRWTSAYMAHRADYYLRDAERILNSAIAVAFPGRSGKPAEGDVDFAIWDVQNQLRAAASWDAQNASLLLQAGRLTFTLAGLAMAVHGADEFTEDALEFWQPRPDWPELFESPEYEAVVSLARRASLEYLAHFGEGAGWEVPGPGEQAELVCWAAVYPQWEGTHAHHPCIHERAVVSGVLYATPTDTPLLLADPRGAPPADVGHRVSDNDKEYEPRAPFDAPQPLFVQEGDVVLFPPWLAHKVPSVPGAGGGAPGESWRVPPCPPLQPFPARGRPHPVGRVGAHGPRGGRARNAARPRRGLEQWRSVWARPSAHQRMF
ncbi:unnamed protein product, partial [Prorocentrum cordatum]